MTNPTRFSRRRLVDEVIDHLRTEISSGHLPTGFRLPPEGKLTQQLGVSRTTLREAIVVLSHDGLVDVRRGDGTYVKAHRVTEQDLRNRSTTELLELRRPLHLELTRLATARRTEHEANQIRQRMSDLAGALETRNAALARDVAAALESAMGAAAHSPLLAELARQTSNALARVKSDDAPVDSWLTALGSLVQSTRGIIDRDAESADRYAMLWLAAQASLLDQTRPAAEYATPEVRRGPRARHAKREMES